MCVGLKTKYIGDFNYLCLLCTIKEILFEDKT